MTAEQQKAKELIEKFGKYAKRQSSGFLVSNEDYYIESAKQCAILCVDEIILSNPHSNPFNTELYSTMEFWQTVRQEIINYKI